MEFYNIPKSKFIKSFIWDSDRVPYPEPGIKGDTFPMTWAPDGHIYAGVGDPLWGETVSGLEVQRFEGGPLDYKIFEMHNMPDYLGWGGNGPKPSGMICVDGVLYLAFQNALHGGNTPHSNKSQAGADAHIVRCVPRWNQWYPSFKAIKEPMFPGFKFGGPSFINFGQDNANARDEYVYAISSDQWDNGSNVQLGRVPNNCIMDPHSWEFVKAFTHDGQPVWSRSLVESIPILSIHRHISLPEMVYLADIKRYLFLTWRLKNDFCPESGTDLIILESPEPWGPFSLVHYEELWEGKEFTPYNPRIPLKWMDAGHKSGWLQFSGTWVSTHDGGFYRSNIRKFKLEFF